QNEFWCHFFKLRFQAMAIYGFTFERLKAIALIK
ncbi:hypothetical protein J612_3916, partial [Acinetobacter baumannii 1471012]